MIGDPDLIRTVGRDDQFRDEKGVVGEVCGREDIIGIHLES